MKIRDGFVSNSSSSSFILRMPERENEDKWLKGMYEPSELMTDEDLKKALEYGFRPTKHHSPSQLEGDNWQFVSQDTVAEKVTNETKQLGFCVTCNEYDVIEFLVKNNIPFSGSTHYGHRSCFFKRGDKSVLWMANLGVEFEMYGHGKGAMKQILMSQNRKKDFKPISKEAVKDILRGQKELRETLAEYDKEDALEDP